MSSEKRSGSAIRNLHCAVAAAVFALLLPSCAGRQLRDGSATGTLPAQIRRDLTVSGEVRIRGEVKVFPGATLTVRPGSRFLFEPLDEDGDGVNESRLVVEGRLVARGEPDSPIIFASASSRPEPGDWLELRIDRSEGNVLEYCVLTHSLYGLHAHFSSGVLANSVIRDNIDGTRFGVSRFRLVGNLFVGNSGKGINLRDSALTIERNEIVGNRHGIFLFERASQSVIASNSFSENSLSDLRYGDFYEGEAPEVRDNATVAGAPLRVEGPGPAIENPVRPGAPVPAAGPRTLDLAMIPSWQRDTGSFVDSPVVPLGDGGLILAATWGGELIWMDSTGGEVLRRVQLPDVIDAEPLRFDGSVLVVSWDRKVRRLDEATGTLLGEVQWEPSPADDHRQAAPLKVGQVVILGLWDGTLGALEPAAMSWVWKVRLDGAIRGRPSFDGRDLWVGTDAGTLWVISADGKVLGSHDLGSPVRTTPAIAGPHGTAVITRDGILTLLSGGERNWSRQLPGQGTYAPPVYIPGSGIAAADGSGAVSMLDLKGALYWRTSLGSAVHSLRRQGDLLWAGTEDGAVVVLQPATGRVLESHAGGGAVHGGPVLLERPPHLAVWGARDGLVRAFTVRLTEGSWEAPQ